MVLQLEFMRFIQICCLQSTVTRCMYTTRENSIWKGKIKKMRFVKQGP
jgi:hypothetical protein